MGRKGVWVDTLLLLNIHTNIHDKNLFFRIRRFALRVTKAQN